MAHAKGTVVVEAVKALQAQGERGTSLLYDTGELRVVERDAGHAVVELLNFALPTREICDTFNGYQAERMSILGFEDVQVHHTKCRVIGAISCVWELSWKARDAG